jgi:calcium/calmodulin-dependent protein kinase I
MPSRLSSSRHCKVKAFYPLGSFSQLSFHYRQLLTLFLIALPPTRIIDKVAMLETEINVLSRVRHPNCVSLLEMFETDDAVYLVTDLAAGGELFDQLLKKGYYTEGDAARLVREILLGVEYLHSLDIVHRDLKPENLLFADTTETARLMITDFGLSKVLTNGNDVLMTACGTPGYVAPEVLEQIGHGKPVDIWSIGVIAYTLLCGYTPFWGEGKMSTINNCVSI